MLIFKDKYGEMSSKIVRQHELGALTRTTFPIILCDLTLVAVKKDATVEAQARYCLLFIGRKVDVCLRLLPIGQQQLLPHPITGLQPGHMFQVVVVVVVAVA